MRGSNYSNSSSNWRWFWPTPSATLRTDSFQFQLGIRYGCERKITTSHSRHRCCRSFFNNHRAVVQLFNVFSFSQPFTRGLSQGSVLAPLLFLFYINNLTSSLNDDAITALFADDISILTTTWKKKYAEVAAQSVVNFVLLWSQGWKINLNADKSEVCPFSAWSNDST